MFRGRKGLGLILCLLSVCRSRSASTQPSGETLLKIEYIERFTRFVDWPAQVLGDRNPRFVICIAGAGPVADYLPREAASERFKDRPPEFRRVQLGDDLTRCHLLFIASTEEPRLRAYLASTAGRPILTMADTPGAGAAGVLVNFYRQGTRVLFEINRAAVEKGGLQFSSRILNLARLVGPESR